MDTNSDDEQYLSIGERALSPSILSTASSGSPLVRNGSSASSSSQGPARSASGRAGRQAAKGPPNGNKLAQMAPIVNSGQIAADWRQDISSNKSDAGDKMSQQQKCQQEKSPRSKLDEAGNKRLGYNMAKSLAFRANR